MHGSDIVRIEETPALGKGERFLLTYKEYKKYIRHIETLDGSRQKPVLPTKIRSKDGGTVAAAACDGERQAWQFLRGDAGTGMTSLAIDRCSSEALGSISMMSARVMAGYLASFEKESDICPPTDYYCSYEDFVRRGCIDGLRSYGEKVVAENPGKYKVFDGWIAEMDKNEKHADTVQAEPSVPQEYARLGAADIVKMIFWLIVGNASAVFIGLLFSNAVSMGRSGQGSPAFRDTMFYFCIAAVAWLASELGWYCPARKGHQTRMTECLTVLFAIPAIAALLLFIPLMAGICVTQYANAAAAENTFWTLLKICVFLFAVCMKNGYSFSLIGSEGA